MNKKVKSTIFLFITAAVWGFAFVAQKFGAEHLGKYAFNGTRFLLGAVSLIPVILIFEGFADFRASKKLVGKTMFAAVVAGIVLFAASTLQQMGIEITGNAGKVGFITALYTVLVPLFNLIIFRKKAGRMTWVGIAVAVVGFYLLSIGKPLFVAADNAVGFAFNSEISIGYGDLITLIGSVFWAFHIITIDRFAREIPSLKFACIQFFVCAALCFVGAAFRESFTWGDITATAIPILYCGIGSVGVAYTCQILGQKDADPSLAAIICSSEAVFSAIGGALILNEVMTAAGYVGCALIFAGMVVTQLPDRKNAKTAEVNHAEK